MTISTEDIILILAIGGTLAGYYIYNRFQEKLTKKKEEQNEREFRKFVGDTLKQRSRKRSREDIDDDYIDTGAIE